MVTDGIDRSRGPISRDRLGLVVIREIVHDLYLGILPTPSECPAFRWLLLGAFRLLRTAESEFEKDGLFSSSGRRLAPDSLVNVPTRAAGENSENLQFCGMASESCAGLLPVPRREPRKVPRQGPRLESDAVNHCLNCLASVGTR